MHFEATSRFAHAATRRFARLPSGAFVRKLSALGYPSHLPQATWANYQTPTVGLKPTSHTFYTAYPTSLQSLIVFRRDDYEKKSVRGGRNISPPDEKVCLSNQIERMHWGLSDQNPVTGVSSRNGKNRTLSIDHIRDMNNYHSGLSMWLMLQLEPGVAEKQSSS